MAGESDAIMAAYKECLNNVSNKLGEEKSRSANTVAERLAARKKLREQRLTRTVDDEVLDQVGLGKVSAVGLILFVSYQYHSHIRMLLLCSCMLFNCL